MKRFPPQTTGLVGYARVSTLEQNLAPQEDALKRVGCLKIFTDIASGAQSERPGLDDLLCFLREGDTLVVWKLDRLGRSLPHLIALVEELRRRKVSVRSLKEHIDTETPAGRMFLNIVAVLAEFERELIVERTHAGLAAARSRGRRGGRPPLLNAAKIQQARLLLAGDTPFKEVCNTIGCSPRTLRRTLAADETIGAGAARHV